ncbi:MAG: hypothetical protein HUJ30_05320 [Gammaproteobacteria bacterium]|nr:hypothetical protein [Gammaproteobacteria bacterium]
MSDHALCPFSKPIIGQFCQCEHAVLSERCSGKMNCRRDADLLESCHELADEFLLKAHFVLSISSNEEELTHAQVMKVRCGGLKGMQRVLGIDAQAVPAVREVIKSATEQYGSLLDFPFNEVMPDIQSFSHRGKRK